MTPNTRRTLSRSLSVAIGYLVAVMVYKHDAGLYGVQNESQKGDDPVALIVFVAVTVVLWWIGDYLTK